MLSITTRRMIATSAAILFVAGCSGSGSSITPGAGPKLSQSSIHVPAGYRAYPGPAVAGPLIVPIAHANHPGFVRPSASGKILFVADANNNVVNMYDPAVKNPPVIGTITSGINVPIGLAVDKRGTLYVVNIGNNTVTEYKKGTVTPSFTINSGMSSPYGIGVDSHREVFVSNLGNNTISGYKHHQTAPFETVNGVGPNPVGVAVDGNDNVFVADDSDNTIYEIPAGSSTSQNSGLLSLTGPIGLAFTTGNELYVANFGANTVGVYPSGSTSPTVTITDSINQPTLDGFAQPGTFFQSDQTGPVEGFKKNKVHPYSVVSGNGRPVGVASYPRLIP